MCVAIVVPAGAKFPSFATLHACWQSNSHGAGIMYPSTTRDGRPGIRLVKGLMTFNGLKNALKKIRADIIAPGADGEGAVARVDVALHFRISSAGGFSAALTHPFSAGGDVALMHNGHISKLAYDDTTRTKIDSANLPESKSRQRVMACFDDEVARLRVRLKSMVAAKQITETEMTAYLEKYEPKHGDAEHVAARIELLAKPKPPESDTSRLAAILSRLPRGWQRNDVIHHMIQESFLGTDRVVLFDANGRAAIIGEKRGEWVDGCWYSNTHWQSNHWVGGDELVKDETTSKPKVETQRPKRPHTGAFQRMCDSGDQPQQTSVSWRQPRLGCTTQAPSAGAPSLPPGAASEDAAIDDRDLPVDPRTWLDDDGEEHHASLT